jgi:molecular chaperone DnaK (HSP70)
MGPVVQVFTTVHDNQTEMVMMIYQGANPVASSNKLLGQFQLLRLAPAPVGVPRVKVKTFKNQ